MPETRPSPNERRRLAEHTATVADGYVTVMVDRGFIFVAATPAVLKKVMTIYTDERLTPIAAQANRHPLDTDTTLHLKTLSPLEAQIAANRLGVEHSRPTQGEAFTIPTIDHRTLAGLASAIENGTDEAIDAADRLATDLDAQTVARIFHPDPWQDLPAVEADLASDRQFTDADQYRRHVDNLYRSARAALDATTVIGVPITGAQRAGSDTVHPLHPNR